MPEFSHFLTVEVGRVSFYTGKLDSPRDIETEGRASYKIIEGQVFIRDLRKLRVFDREGNPSGKTIYIEKDEKYLIALKRIVVARIDHVAFYRFDGSELPKSSTCGKADLAAAGNHFLVSDDNEMRFFNQDGSPTGKTINESRPRLTITADYIFLFGEDSTSFYTTLGEYIKNIKVKETDTLLQSGKWIVAQEGKKVRVFDETGEQQGEDFECDPETELVILP